MPLTTELIYWINERENMREHKEAGLPYPHSGDPVMASTRFTNVRREDDKVTRWLKQHWRDPYHDHPNLLVATVLSRMVNYIPTLEEIGFPEVWDSSEYRVSMKLRRIRKEKIWSSAYTISTCGIAMDKIDYVIGHVCSTVAIHQHGILAPTNTLDSYHRRLMSVDGLGSFLAAQVVADLKHTPGHPLSKAPDWMTWAAHGPGSLKGLAYFWEVDRITPSLFASRLQKAYNLVAGKIPELSMQDFQNCMCEFSKFMRIRSGGHARNGYGN
jgi:hypothetical protein